MGHNAVLSALSHPGFLKYIYLPYQSASQYSLVTSIYYLIVPFSLPVDFTAQILAAQYLCDQIWLQIKYAPGQFSHSFTYSQEPYLIETEHFFSRSSRHHSSYLVAMGPGLSYAWIAAIRHEQKEQLIKDLNQKKGFLSSIQLCNAVIVIGAYCTSFGPLKLSRIRFYPWNLRCLRKLWCCINPLLIWWLGAWKISCIYLSPLTFRTSKKEGKCSSFGNKHCLHTCLSSGPYPFCCLVFLGAFTHAAGWERGAFRSHSN